MKCRWVGQGKSGQILVGVQITVLIDNDRVIYLLLRIL